MASKRKIYDQQHNKKNPPIQFRCGDDPEVQDILELCEKRTRSKFIKTAIKFYHNNKVSNTDPIGSNTHHEVSITDDPMSNTDSVLLSHIEFLMDFFEEIKLTKSQRSRITQNQRLHFQEIAEVLIQNG